MKDNLYMPSKNASCVIYTQNKKEPQRTLFRLNNKIFGVHNEQKIIHNEHSNCLCNYLSNSLKDFPNLKVGALVAGILIAFFV